MKSTKDKIKLIFICLLVLAIILLIIYAFNCVFVNKDSDDVLKVSGEKFKYTMGDDQLDYVKMPEVNIKVKSDTLPKFNDTLTDIKVDTLKKLFETSKKSIVLLVKEGCSYCDEFEPLVKEILSKNNLNAYKINISKYSDKDMKELYKYINFRGTPTTYIIGNGKVLHSLSGTVDKETFISYLDYFYIRNN